MVIPFAPFYNPATLFLGIVHIYVEQTGRAQCLSIWSLDHQQARHRHRRRGGTGSEGSPPPQQHCAHAGADAGGGHGASTGHCVLSSPTSMLRPEGAEHRYLSMNLYLPTNRWPDARKGHREEGSHRTQPAPRKKASGNARETMRDESTRGRIP